MISPYLSDEEEEKLEFSTSDVQHVRICRFEFRPSCVSRFVEQFIFQEKAFGSTDLKCHSGTNGVPKAALVWSCDAAFH